MPRIVFLGRIYPERADITFRVRTPEGRCPAFQRAAIGPVPAFTIELSLLRSQIIAICNLPNFRDEWIPDIRNCVDEMARSWVDLFGFLEGAAYQLEITAWVDPNTGHHELLGHLDSAARLALQLPKIAELVQQNREEGMNLVALALTDDALRLALAECRRALLYAASTAAHCYRAVEGIRKGLVGGDTSPATWAAFRERVRVAETPLRSLADKSVPVRHGQEPYISSGDRSAIFAFTWKIVERYMICRLRYPGNQLPADLFPMIEEI